MCKKNFIPISIGFCVIALQIYREILKKYRKRVITLQKNNFFKNLRKQFLDIYIRNGMPKFESSRLNGVAVIAKTYIHTYTPTHIHTHTHTHILRTQVIPKKTFFAVIDYFSNTFFPKTVQDWNQLPPSTATTASSLEEFKPCQWQARSIKYLLIFIFFIFPYTHQCSLISFTFSQIHLFYISRSVW